MGFIYESFDLVGFYEFGFCYDEFLGWRIWVCCYANFLVWVWFM